MLLQCWIIVFSSVVLSRDIWARNRPDTDQAMGIQYGHQDLLKRRDVMLHALLVLTLTIPPSFFRRGEGRHNGKDHGVSGEGTPNFNVRFYL